MSSKSQFSSALIIGADSVIGSLLFQCLPEISGEIYGTTRRNAADSDKNLIDHVDLALPLPNALNQIAPEIVFICAAVTSFLACEANPSATEKINAYAARDIARHYLNKGSFVVFLSSSAVFDGATRFPNEDFMPTFTTEYGRQKALAESLLIKLDPDQRGIAIVRLTKVLSGKNAVVSDIIEKLKRHKICTPFNDMIISPITNNYVFDALARIATLKRGGIFHLSGSRDVTYVELAQAFARKFNLSCDLIQPIPSTQANVKLMYKPAFAALGMARTVEVVGIQAQNFADVTRDLFLRNR